MIHTTHKNDKKLKAKLEWWNWKEDYWLSENKDMRGGEEKERHKHK